MYDFPPACPAHLPDGCARATVVAPHGLQPPLSPLMLRAPRAAVADAAMQWAATARGMPLPGVPTGGLLHLRFVSRLFGFADDVLLSLSACGPRGEPPLTRVQAHSQLRLGRGDLGVNAARTRALWHHLEAQFPVAHDAQDAACES